MAGANIGGIAIDITESKRADEALRESELRFRTMISAIPSPTYEAMRTVTTFSSAISGSPTRV